MLRKISINGFLRSKSSNKNAFVTYSRLYSVFKNIKLRHYTDDNSSILKNRCTAISINLTSQLQHPFHSSCYLSERRRGFSFLEDNDDYSDLHKLKEYTGKAKQNPPTIDTKSQREPSYIEEVYNSKKILKYDQETEKKHNFKKLQKYAQETKEDLSEYEVNTTETHSHLDEGLAKFSQLFPSPKVTLNNWDAMIGTRQFVVQYKHNEPKKHKKQVHVKSPGWNCIYKFHKPEAMIFEGSGITKTIASHKAALNAVAWLYQNKLMTKDGYPIHSTDKIEELKKDQNKPIYFQINDVYEKNICDLIDKFNMNIKPLLETIKGDKIVQTNQPVIPADLRVTSIEEDELSDDELLAAKSDNQFYKSERDFHDDIFGTPLEEKDPELMKKRSVMLANNLRKRRPETELPISEYREKIIKLVNENRAVVIRGATGCGKSTRIPSYILDSFSEKEKGAECSILVSEPRRVAALSLASTVSKEREEQMGDVCGHQVRLSTVLPQGPGGVLLYCTAGALLRRLASTPNLPGCSHIILDEAHERSVDSDTVMMLAKRALELNPKLKVIVMSATIDTELFSRYFGNCPIIDIPGRTFPVKSYFLEDFASKLKLDRSLENSSKEDGPVMVNPFDIIKVIKWVDRNKPEGAILCFLPGWSEIKRVLEEFKMTYSSSRTHIVVPIHSRLSNEEQRKIFSSPPPGVRKIILATNIAETSITIGDVVYVIDSGVHKENRLLSAKGLSSLDNDWISKANASQRKGRAGRVTAGECFHMYTKEKYNSFDDNPTPEIMRVPLEKTVLDCKTYSVNEKAYNFLSQFPQSPSEDAIKIAINDLIDLGALDKHENLTPLGQRIASFTTHPKLSKALVYSTIFGVSNPIVDITTILSNSADLFTHSHSAKQDIRKIKREYHPSSDHQSLYWIVSEYENMIREEGKWGADYHCREKFMRKEKLRSVIDLRKVCYEHLYAAKMISSSHHNAVKKYSKYDAVDELVKGVLLSGLNTLIYTKTTLKLKGKLGKEPTILTDRGQRAFISSDSVNHGIEKKLTNCVLLHCGAIHSEERRGVLIRDTSIISPLTLLLFSNKIHVDRENPEVETMSIRVANKKVLVEIPQSHGEALIKLREMIWSVVDYYIQRDNNQSDEDFQKVVQIEEFKDEMLKTLAKILNEYEIVVEYTKPT